MHNVGAGLPAIADCQALSLPTDTPSSQASQLPHLIAFQMGSFSGAWLSAARSAGCCSAL
ncbi:hypothetical protein C7A12_23230 [Pseudomonas fluorescens]|nr:hypothetical protein C7A12_23230 [Pseudomonas fluorescens]PRW74464.1 hypothetical protein C7A13_22895 [Pseudomonas fluorescens]